MKYLSKKECYKKKYSYKSCLIKGNMLYNINNFSVIFNSQLKYLLIHNILLIFAYLIIMQDIVSLH